MVANRTRRTPSRRAFKQAFVLAQQAPGAYVDGVFVPGVATLNNLNGSVQPADSDLVNQLAENERESDSLSIWTNGLDALGNLIAVRPVKFGASQAQGDVVEYDGFDWNVRRVWNYNEHGHQQILAVKVEAQDG